MNPIRMKFGAKLHKNPGVARDSEPVDTMPQGMAYLDVSKRTDVKQKL